MALTLAASIVRTAAAPAAASRGLMCSSISPSVSYTLVM